MRAEWRANQWWGGPHGLYQISSIILAENQWPLLKLVLVVVNWALGVRRQWVEWNGSRALSTWKMCYVLR